MSTVPVTPLGHVLMTMARTIVDNTDYFSELDAVAGDGDFGYTLRGGFEIVVADFDSYDCDNVPDVLQTIGTIMARKVGGSSGPLWGTAFLRAAAAAAERGAVGRADVVDLLRAAITGIAERGGAEVGDKTLLDALMPATDALDESLGTMDDCAAVAAAARAARVAADATSDMVARRGRASYLGERSRGSVDPGAVAVAVILEAISSAWPPSGAAAHRALNRRPAQED